MPAVNEIPVEITLQVIRYLVLDPIEATKARLINRTYRFPWKFRIQRHMLGLLLYSHATRSKDSDLLNTRELTH